MVTKDTTHRINKNTCLGPETYYSMPPCETFRLDLFTICDDPTGCKSYLNCRNQRAMQTADIMAASKSYNNPPHRARAKAYREGAPRDNKVMVSRMLYFF